MSKVVNNFKIGNFLIIILDQIENNFNKVEINGILYEITIPYDIPNAIAVKTDGDFIGKTVNFI